MKNRWLGTAILLIALAGASEARAFSTEQSNAPNGVGVANLADPDEKMPAFMVAPDTAGGRTQTLSATPPSVTMPSAQENSPGAASFNQAFGHQQDK